MTTIVLEDAGFEKGWLAGSARSLLVAAGVVIVLAILVVFSTRQAWLLLGVGRGLVGPDSYHYTGLVVLLGTTFGQFIGWAAGSALLAYGWCFVTGSSATLKIIQSSVTVVYLGLAAVPLFFYHVLFGQPLAHIPREGLNEWLYQNYPGAYGLLMIGHPIVDWSLVPLGLGVLAILWGYVDPLRQNRRIQTLFLTLVLLTSFAVALSLAIHSTLAHIRIGS